VRGPGDECRSVRQSVTAGADPNEIAAADLPFFSVDGLPAGQSKSESWIESWLSGKGNGAPL